MRRRLVCVACAAMLAVSAGATTPLFDTLEIGGRNVDLHQLGQAWLAVPPSPEVSKIRLQEQCSAIGSPRGRYRVDSGRLWLVGLYTCGREVSLDEAYGRSGPILATWVSGRVQAHYGKPLCQPRSYPGYSVLKRRLTLEVQSGLISQSNEEGNEDRPEVPRNRGADTPACLEVRR